uniref:Uncharacterized protein n=1 Tax=Meloidogyne enterolobii TaxID=390850 RepID=A0A6V7U0C6_MELEN|nr:unnamed protein product [Meloidogyne enterolobii]
MDYLLNGKICSPIREDLPMQLIVMLILNKTTILAWHDMLVHMSDRDSEAFNLSKIPEPIL